jgi:protein O-GlcNAc transferase
MAILRAAPASVLWLYEGAPGVAANLRAQATLAGIDAGRLVFAAHAPHAEHLARHALADLVLDSWPYGAHTTASDALRMGVPLLTLPGKGFASRVGASLLTALGLRELIAADTDAYAATAVRLARSRSALAALKDQLALAIESSAVFDPVAFARVLETAFQTLNGRRLAGAAPRDLDLT